MHVAELSCVHGIATPSSRRYLALGSGSRRPLFALVETVQRDGTIRWRRHRVFVSPALRGELVAVEPDLGTRRVVLFGPLLVGYIDDARPEFLRPARRPRKHRYLELVSRVPV